MNPFWMVFANVGGVAAFFGGIALLVWMDHRAKHRRREFEHVERMKAIELGRPLEDATVARYKALGAIGVAVPIVAFSAGLLGSVMALGINEPMWKAVAFCINWVVCGAVPAAVVPIVLQRMKDHPPDPDAEE
ncbi:MAG: hypothetical protein MUF18_14890 [Fimbriiglobus sp.]|jgi:hypothetical protein|nr:hypothetical protein [Fimbriiglobus sp.]